MLINVTLVSFRWSQRNDQMPLPFYNAQEMPGECLGAVTRNDN